MSHMKGVKHLKKQMAQSQITNELPIVPIKNPSPTRKKQPVRLQQKIMESIHKIVGLRFVKEFIACSDSEMEPHYGNDSQILIFRIYFDFYVECHLCETQGMSNCIFQHLIGQNHRQNYVNHVTDNDPAQMCLSQVKSYHHHNAESSVPFLNCRLISLHLPLTTMRTMVVFMI